MAGLGNISCRVAELSRALDIHSVGYDLYASANRLADYIRVVPELNAALVQPLQNDGAIAGTTLAYTGRRPSSRTTR